MKKYRHLFFDLDRTLWDFESNSRETIQELFFEMNLNKSIADFDSFYETYKVRNAEQWAIYREGKVRKNDLRVNRFYLAMTDHNFDIIDVAKKFDILYVERSPLKKKLFPDVQMVLEDLSSIYKLHIITNGFKEVQYIKLKNCDLIKYFDKIFTSEEVGSIKPKKEIFRHALKSCNAKKTESIMIGDDLEVDILGAKNVGLDQIFVNYDRIKHSEEITHEIFSFREILNIL